MSANSVIKNFEILTNLCNKLGDRSKSVTALLNEMGETFATAPASTRVGYHDCYAGGLVSYSLRTLQNARQLNTQFDFNISHDSMILVCLLHAIGKAGDLDGPMYEAETSDWHRDKLGKHFKVREDMQKMPWPDRSLFLLQHFGVKLSRDEWIAIKMVDGRYHKEEGSWYEGSEPGIATLLEMAAKISVAQGKKIC